MVQSTLDVHNEAPVNAKQTKPTLGLTVSQFIIKQLTAWGVKRIYGVIGDANLYLLDELAKQNQIQYIACRHEGAAALMASAEAKLTGRIAVCLATSGPGIANLLNGLADAAMDRASVLAITGQVATDQIGTRAKQYINQQQLLSALTDHSELLTHPNALPQLLHSALLQSHLQGKVTHLSIPKDVYQKQVQGVIVPYSEHLHQTMLTPLTEIKNAAEQLKHAHKPILYVGRGIQDVTEQVRELAEKLQAGVVTTLPARSLFPNNHPLYVGGLGQAGSEAASTLFAESDLIVMLGATWWPEDYVPTQANILQFDKNAEMMGVNHPLTTGIIGDLRQVLPELLNQMRTENKTRDAWMNRVTEVKTSWKLIIESEANQSGTPIPPQRLMKALSDFAAPDAVIAVDTGDHTLWFDRIFQAKRQRILLSGRWRTMGFALPAAIAAQLEFPERQVIALVGDGGSVQTLLELQTAVQYELPILMLIVNNGCYAMEKNRMEVSGLQTLGSRLTNPDFVKLAEACGAMGWRAENSQQLEQCLLTAFRLKKTAVIEILTAETMVPHTKI